MDGLGKNLVSACLQENSFEEANKLNLTSEDVFSDAKDIWKFILKYAEEFGKYPNEETIQEETGVSLPVPEEPSTYYAQAVRKRKLGKFLSNAFEKAASLLEERKPDESLAAVKEIFKQDEAKPTELVNFRENAKERLEEYKRLATTSEGFDGVPTPWEGLDELIQGWADGTLNVVAAKSNLGKSWCSVILAADAKEKEKKVLLVTLEMTNFRFLRRTDAVVTKKAFKKFRDAEFEDDEEFEEIKKTLTEETKGDIFLADKKLVRRVSDVSALVFQYKPDLLIIDGAYRFEPEEKSKSTWADTAATINNMQLAAERTGIPWVITTQQNEETSKKKEAKPSGYNVRYGKEYLIAADSFIILHQTEDMRFLKIMELHAVKIRDAVAGIRDNVIRINWDLDKMLFTEIGGEEDDMPEEYIVDF